jgi:predicted dehydrogenase
MRVLIIGLGSIASKHIFALRKLVPGVTIYALRSHLDARQEEGIINIFDLEAVKEQLNFAIISNPTAAHYITIKQLLPLRIPLFIEKPLFHTLENGDSLISQCNTAQVATYVACNLRFHPCVREMKAYLEKSEGTINEVNVYCGSYLPGWRPQQDFRKSYSAIPEMGGGVHLDLIHELDYICWLLGRPDHTSKILTHHSNLKIAAVDYANYQFSYPRFTTNVILNYFRRDAKRVMEIVMDDNTVEMNLLKNTIAVNGDVIFTQPTDINYSYIKQMEYFIEAIENNTPLMNDISEAYQVLKICLQ